MEHTTHKGKIIEVIQREVEENGKQKVFEIARRSPGVRLIISKENQIFLNKEFCHETKGYDYRLPGGKVFDTLDEYGQALESSIDIVDHARKAVIKEAYEESGIEVKDTRFLHRSICGATIEWDLFYFEITDFTQTIQHLEEGEDIEVVAFDRESVRKMCLDGTIGEERSALILLRYLAGNL